MIFNYSKSHFLFLALLLFALHFYRAQTPCFSTAVQYNAGGAPNRMTTADFNNDGIPDLAVANFTSNTISVLLGSGTGTFGIAVNYICGSGPFDVYSADFNADGNMDLATANSNGNNVSILLGTGLGVFGLQSTFAVGSGPSSIYSADFNSDGKLDLAISNLGAGNVSVLIGLGPGTFSSAVNYNVGSNPRGLSAADFNGDGNYDLAVANSGSSNLSILFGSPTGTFATAVNYATASGPYDALAADVNNDGNIDLALPCLSSNSVSILMGSISGTFAAAVYYATPAAPSQIVYEDFNGDGKKDLATSNTGPNSVSILLGSNTGTFAAATNFAVGASIPRDIVAADFNLDGVTDIATANNGSNNTSVLLACSMPGASAKFDGVNDYVDLGSTNNLKPSGALTAEAWAYRANWTGTFSILGNPNNAGFGIRTPSGGVNITGVVWRNGSFGSVTYPLASLSSGWHHFALTYNGRYLNFYIDGLLVGTDDAGATYPITYVANNTLIGAESGAGASPVAGRYINGKIDEVRIWNVARNHCQIQTFMNCEIPTTASGLVANYHFNHGTSGANNSGTTTLADATGNGNNGTLTNFLLSGINSNWIVPGGVVSSYTTAVAPTNSLNIVGNGNNVVAGSTVPSLSNFTDFGSATTRTFTAQNVGTGTLYIGNVTFSGANASQFTFTSNASSSITTAGSSTFGVIFTPTAIGTSSAIVSFPSNDCTHPTYSFVISATASQGSALDFDGANDFVNTNLDADVDVMPNTTWEAWVYPTSIAGVDKFIFSIGDGSLDRGVSTYSNQFYVSMGSGYNPIATFTINNWYHVAASFNTSTNLVKVYINGVLKYQGLSNWTVGVGTTVNKLKIGSAGAAPSFIFDGSIDEVRIWNTVRSQCEIQTFMNCEIPTTASGLVANYHFNQGIAGTNNSTVTALTDATGVNTGTLTGFALSGAGSNWMTPSAIVNGYTTSVAPANSLNIVGNGNNILAGSSTPTVSNFTDFGSVTTRTFTAQNVGSGTLFINNVTFSGANASLFTFTSNASNSITTAGSSTFGIIFTPTASGTSSAVVLITSNDCTSPTYSFVIQGTPPLASALNFDGTSDYVNCGAILPGSYTKEAWINLTSGSTHNNIMSGGAGSSGHAFYVPSSTGFRLSGGHNGTYTAVMDPTPLVYGTWYHVAISYNAGTGTMKLYKNGLLVSSAYSIPAPTSSAVTIGWYDSGSFFKGSIDEVRLWNTERTACEIQTYMNCEIPTTATGLIANYHFNQGSAGLSNITTTTLTDAAASNTGTLIGFGLTGLTSNWVAPGGIANGYTTAVAPSATLNVVGNGNTILAGSTTPTVSNFTDFGSVTTRTFTAQNIGTGPLYINSVTFSGANASLFTFTSNASNSITTAGSSTFGIIFTPTAAGTSSAVVLITSNDCTNPTYSFVIQGTPPLASALNFDGTNDYVNCGSLLNTSYTKEAWVRLTAGSTQQNIVSGGSGGTGSAFFAPNSYGNRLSSGHNGTWNYVQDPTPLTYSVWHHVAVSYDGPNTTMKLYKNGVLVSSNYTVPAHNSNAVTLGYYDGSSFLAGSLDEVRIWNTVRTQCEIQTYMDCEIPSTASGLVANYHFNQGIAGLSNITTTLLADAAASNTGTLIGFGLTGVTSNWVAPGGVANGYSITNAPTPTLTVFGNGSPVAFGSNPTISNFTDFQSNTSRTFIVSNPLGASTLYINQVAFTGSGAAQFSVTTLPPSSLLANTSGSLSIAFTPTAVGSSSAIVSISSNDCAHPTYSFIITASATVASALKFDGVNDYVILPNNASSWNIGNNFSIETWIKPTTTSGNQLILYTGYGCIDCPAWALSIGPENTCSFSGGNSGRIIFMATDKTSTNSIVQSNASPPVGVWTHVAVTGDGSKLSMYINGVLQNTAALSFAIPSSIYRNIGADPSITGGCSVRGQFSGALDELRFWNKPLCLTEIVNNMNCEIPTVATGLTANYHFNQGVANGINGSITTLTDVGGGAATGSLSNFALTGTLSNWVSASIINSGTSCTLLALPDIDVQGNATSIPNGAATGNPAYNTSFINAFLPGTSTRTFVIYNIGTSSLSISNYSLSGLNANQYSITSAPSAVVAPSGSTSIVVTFSPTSIGTKTAIVNIISNDCSKSPFTFAVSAIGLTTGEALNFDGTNDYVSVPDFTIGTGDFTMESWIRPTAYTTPDMYILSNRLSNFGTSGNWFNLAINLNKFQIELGQAAAATNTVFAGTSTITLGNWQHVAVVRSGLNYKLYVNGILETSVNDVIIRNLTGNFGNARIGGWPENGTGRWFNGDIDEVRVWNTARTQCQLQSYMKCEIPSTSANLLANYHFNQGTLPFFTAGVTTLNDASGNSLNGTLTNFALTSTVSNWVVPGSVVSGNSAPTVPTASISVSGNGNSILNNATSTSTLNFTNFGSSSTRTFVIANASGTLNIGTPYFTGANISEFSLTVLPASSLAVGNTSFVVAFTPTAGGTRSCVVNINSNDCVNPIYNFVIDGSAPVGSALSFDGASDGVNCGSAINLNGQSFTIEFWAKRNSINSGDYVVGQGGSLFTNTSLHIGFRNTNDFTFAFYSNDINYLGTANTDGNYHHWACVYKANTVGTDRFVYLDGVLVASDNSNGDFVGTGNFFLGNAAFGGGNDLDGVLDELRVWNVARTQCQIQSFMNCEIPTSAAGLIANYHFNQGSAGLANPTFSTLVDVSGNGNTGTLGSFNLSGNNSNWVNTAGVVSGYSTSSVPASTMIVLGNGNSILNNATTTSTLNLTDFGSVANRTFVIQNSGTSNLNAINLLVTGLNASEFSVTVLPSSTVAPSGTTSFVVAFTPTASGARTATININSNDCANPVYNFAIEGTAPVAEALSFDGSNDVAGRATITTNVSNISMQAKVNWRGTNGFNQMILYNGNSGSSGYGIYNNVGSGAVSILLGGISFYPFNYTLVPNQWTSLTAVFKNGIAECYANGLLVNTINIATPALPTNSFVVGSNNIVTEIFNGTVDEVLFWNKALTQCEIQTFQNCEIPGAAANLLANYHFNQGSAGLSNPTVTTVTDASGNNNNLTLTNFALTGTLSNWVSPGAVVSGFTTTSAPSSSISVSGNGNTIANNSIITSTLNFTDFGSATSRTFVIANSGLGTLNVGAVSISGLNASEFSITTLPSLSLAASATTSFVVTLTPTNTGVRSATINIFNNTCNTPIFLCAIQASVSSASALRFDGTNDRVNTIDINPATIPVMTFEAWVYRTGGSGNQTIIGNDNGGWDRVLIIQSGVVHVWAGRDIVTTFTSALNTWEHYAVTWSASEVRCIKNGTQVFSTSGESPSSSSTNAGIGAVMAAWLFPFQGIIDEARIWNTARTQCEIQTYMNAEITSTASGLIANYHFNQGIPSGNNTGITNALDATGVNNGTLTNFALTGATSNFVSPSNVAIGYTTTSAPSVILNLSGNGNNVPQSVLTSTANNTNFGTNASRTFSASNTGTNTLYINNIVFSGANAAQFSVNASPASSVASSGSSTFSILFTPTVVGTSSAIVNISSNDCTNPTYSFVITASATPASALNFDGSNDYVQANHTASIMPTNSISLEAWVNLTSTTGIQYVISKGTSDVTLGHYGLYVNSGLAGFHLYQGAHVSAQSSSSLSAGVWNHLAGTWDGSILRLYVNGILSGTQTLTGPLSNNTGSLQIGRLGAPSASYQTNGKIDEVRIWNTTRSQCEIQTFMNAEITSTASGLVANYHFNQGIPSGSNTAVTALTDATGANTGTLTNFALTSAVSNWVSPGSIANDFTVTSSASVTLALSGNGNNIPLGVVTNTSNNTDFGTNSTRTFSASNTGTNTLYINYINFTGANASQFTVNASPASSLAANASSTFSILFTPTAVGTSSAIVNITSNDCAYPSYSFVISATTPTASALKFSGSGDYISIANTSSLNAFPLTVEAWFKSSYTGTVAAGVVAKYVSNSSNGWLTYLTNGYLYAHYFNNAGNYVNFPITSNVFVADDNWHHMAFVVDGTGGKIYIDGVLSSGNSSWTGTPAAPTTAQNINIGLYDAYFPGSIDEVRIWNVARTQCDIQTNMLAEITTTAVGLMANYHFNQGIPFGINTTINTLTDAAGSNTGNLSGSFALTGSVSNWVSPGGVANNFTNTIAPTASLSITGNGNNIPQGTTTSTNNFTDFGTAPTRTFVIQNAPSGTLNINTITFTGANGPQFSITASPASSLGASATSSFVVLFTPTAVGSSSAVVNISSNDCTNPTYSFVITASTTPASALNFDGANDYVSLGSSSAIKPTNALSIETWANLNNWGAVQSLVSNTQSNGYAISVGGGNLYGNVRRNGAYAVVSTPTTGISAGWHHVAMTFDGRYTKLYLDGILKSTDDAGGTYSITYAANSTFIGAEGFTGGTPEAGYYSNGSYDEVRIWNTPRTQCEIQTYMNAEITTTASGLVANYHFNQGIPSGANSTQTLLADAAGVNTGTLINMALTSGSVSNWVSPGGLANGFTTTIAPTASLTVSGNGNSVPQSAITTTLNNTDFGTNSSSTFSIANTTGTLSIHPIFFTGPNAAQFSVTTVPAASLTAGGTSFVITLTPTNTGISTATVNIPSNDCTNPTYSFVITGSTTAASALSFDGSNDVVNCGSDPSLDIAQGTWEAWVKLSTLGTNSRIFFKENTDGGGSGMYESFFLASSGKFQGDLKIGLTNYQVIGTTNPVINTWYHVAATYDGVYFKLYVNGVLDGITNVSGGNMNPGTGRLSLGASITNPLGSGFTGVLDEARLWNVVRSQCEIQTYMNAEITSTASGLVANYHFNQGIPSGSNIAVTTLVDAAGANSGTLTNFALTGAVSNWVSPGGVANGATTTIAPTSSIALSANSNSIAYGAATTSTLNFTNFNGVNTRTFVITNNGASALNVATPYFTGGNASEFSVSVIPATTVAASGGTTFFVVVFTPTASGQRTVNVNIDNNDCSKPVFNFMIEGSAGIADALNFDGTNDYLNGPILSTATNSVTLQAKVYWNGSTGFHHTILQNGPSGYGLVIQASSGNVGMYIGGAPMYTTSYTMPFQQWTDISAVLLNNQATIYANGIQVASFAYGTAPTTTGSCVMGGGPGDHFRGALDEVRVWEKALSQCEIQTYLNTEIPGSLTNLKANYHFNQGSANLANPTTTIVLDASGNNYSLTANNFAMTGTLSNWISPGGVVKGFTAVSTPSAEINISGNGNVILDGATTTNTLNFTDFGASTSRTFVIQNTSTVGILYVNTPILFTGPNASEFSVTTAPPASIAASSSGSFVVSFIPLSLGVKTATINIPNSDCDEDNYDFVITNTATVGQALNFDGVNDFVTRPIFSNATNNITLEAKVNWNGPSAGNKVIVFNGNAGGNGYGFFIPSNSSSVNWMYGGLSFNSAFTLTPNQWTSLAMVITSNLLTIYKDGILTNSIAIGNPATPLGGFSIGSDHFGAQTFNGSIDEVRFWNRALCQGEIQNYLNCEIATSGPSLTANYHFNQGIANGLNPAANTLTDLSGNSYNAVLSNFALSSFTSNWLSPGAVTSGSTCTAYLDPEINLVGNGTNILDGSVATSTLDNTDFSNVSLSGNIVRTFTIQNIGNGPLTVTSITLTGANANSFTVGALSPSSPIAASSSAVFSVTYTPASVGTHTATVNIISSDCDESNYDFVISGTSSPGSALVLDGSDDYVNCGNIVQASYTKEAWIKIGTSSNGNNLLSAGNGVTGHAFWAPGIYSYKLSAGHDNIWNAVQDPTALSFGTWYHVAVTYDAASATMNLYKNGLLVSTGTVSPFGGSAPLSIGAFSGSFVTNGTMDEVRIWNRPLCQAEIQNNMNCEIPTIGNGLVANYHFNQGVGFGSNTVTALTDASGNANTGTLTNIAGTGTVSNWVSTSTVTTGSSCTPYFTPEIDLIGNGVSIPDDAATPSLTNHTSFSTVCVNASIVRTYTIQNTGTANLTVTAISISGPNAGLFTIGSLSPASPITPSNQAVFSVTFVPTSAGVKSATINVANNDCNEGTYDFVITGTCNALPTVTASATSSVICDGQSTTLNGLGADTYSWTGGVTDGVPFSPTITSSYTVVGSSTLTGCTSTNIAVQSITVNSNPTITAISNTTVICEGSTTTFTAFGASTYTWNPGLVNTSTISTSPTITTIYSVTGTSSLGCASTNTASITLSVNPLPTVSITASSASICAGNSATLTGSGAATYTWNAGNIVASSITVNPNTSTSYTLDGTSSAGCTSTNSAIQLITVNNNPTITISTSTTDICLGSNATLTANGAVNYTWNPGVISGSVIVISPTTSSTYSLVGSDAVGCLSSNMAVQSITVNPIPTVSASISNSIVCSGSTVTLSASGANSYTWNPGSIIGAIVTATANSTTSYTLIGENSAGCTNTNLATADVTVNALPNIVAVSTNSSVCEGTSITLNASGANTYTWSGGVIGNVSFIPTSTTDYTVTGTDANGCENTAVIGVTVNSIPTVSVSISNTLICFGDSLTLTGSGASSYTWTGNVLDNVAFTPTVSASYTLTGDNAGCTSTNVAVSSITVNAIPTVSILASDTSICAGSTVALAGAGAISYTWTNGVLDNSAFSPSVSAIYTVTGFDASGCKDTAMIALTIKSGPTLEVVSSNSISCDIKSATLTVNGAITYSWSTNENTQDIIVSPKVETTYTVIGTNSLGCRDTTTIIQIVVCDSTGQVEIFTGFTPNNDGVNDVWKIDNITEHPDNRVTIFNRWGQKIFDVKGYDNVTKYWPSKDEAGKLLSTTYYYIIDLDGKGKKLIKGWVEVMK